MAPDILQTELKKEGHQQQGYLIKNRLHQQKHFRWNDFSLGVGHQTDYGPKTS